jgi:hypothetical protein
MFIRTKSTKEGIKAPERLQQVQRATQYIELSKQQRRNDTRSQIRINIKMKTTT